MEEIDSIYLKGREREKNPKVIKLGFYKFGILITIPMVITKKINKTYRKRK